MIITRQHTAAWRCEMCSSKGGVKAQMSRWNVITLKCRFCDFEDVIVNPFGDIRIFLDAPKNWCLVYVECSPIEFSRGTLL